MDFSNICKLLWTLDGGYILLNVFTFIPTGLDVEIKSITNVFTSVVKFKFTQKFGSFQQCLEWWCVASSLHESQLELVSGGCVCMPSFLNWAVFASWEQLLETQVHFYELTCLWCLLLFPSQILICKIHTLILSHLDQSLLHLHKA